MILPVIPAFVDRNEMAHFVLLSIEKRTLIIWIDITFLARFWKTYKWWVCGTIKGWNSSL